MVCWRCWWRVKSREPVLIVFLSKYHEQISRQGNNKHSSSTLSEWMTIFFCSLCHAMASFCVAWGGLVQPFQCRNIDSASRYDVQVKSFILFNLFCLDKKSPQSNHLADPLDTLLVDWTLHISLHIQKTGVAVENTIYIMKVSWIISTRIPFSLKSCKLHIFCFCWGYHLFIVWEFAWNNWEVAW